MWILPGAGGSVNLTREIRGLIVKNLSSFSTALAVQQHNARAASISELCKVCCYSSSWNTLEDNALVVVSFKRINIRMLDCWSCDAQSLRSSTSISKCQTRKHTGDTDTLGERGRDLDSFASGSCNSVNCADSGSRIGMLGEDIEEDLSYILSANV